VDAIVCPKCGHYDKIEKVSAIISHQTRTRTEQELRTETHTDFDGKSHTSTYSVPYDVVESTDLVKYLRLPPKPEAKRRGCLVAIILILVGIGFGSILYSIVLQQLIGDVQRIDTTISISDLIKCGLLILVLGMIFLSVRAKDASEVREETPHWEHAMHRQEKAYYCYRDDIVFIPVEDNRYASLRQAIAFFYER